MRILFLSAHTSVRRPCSEFSLVSHLKSAYKHNTTMTHKVGNSTGALRGDLSETCTTSLGNNSEMTKYRRYNYPSFTFQRHFATFNISFPGREAVHSIYNSILSQHLELPAAGFPHTVQRLSSSITDLAIDFHAKVTATFLPTAVKFHYVFNLRDLTNVFQVRERN